MEIILIWFRIEFDTLYLIKKGLYDKNDGMKKGNKIYLEDLKGENRFSVSSKFSVSVKSVSLHLGLIHLYFIEY